MMDFVWLTKIRAIVRVLCCANPGLCQWRRQLWDLAVPVSSGGDVGPRRVSSNPCARERQLASVCVCVRARVRVCALGESLGQIRLQKHRRFLLVLCARKRGGTNATCQTAEN